MVCIISFIYMARFFIHIFNPTVTGITILKSTNSSCFYVEVNVSVTLNDAMPRAIYLLLKRDEPALIQ